uniref:Uncharacterized protein n=1 Tax=Rangifer tarandus platyrhynchus TaxID=3082113 RepID=A0ACB0DW48_RANTA|nr:unnamed protein product [Rangifer tarandus platyrhynchus]
MESQRNISEFIFWGLSYNQNIQIFCFVFFLLCYIAILVGNLLILVSIRYSPLFHQPMYYFLSHLSSMDICYTSCVTPKLISDLLLGRKAISYGNCMLQVFSLHFLGMIEICILTVMAFDHFSLPFCGPNEIGHYYCDIFPLLKVACTDTYITGVLVVANSGMVALVTFVLLFGSYVIILFTLRNHSAEGRRKALSTCESHITVVILFFGPSVFAYLRHPTTFPEDKIFSLFYTIIAPMFNPLIYTLRNTKMKKVMRRVWYQKMFSEENHN